MERHDQKVVDRSEETGPAVKSRQQRYAGAILLSSFGLLLLAVVLIELFEW